MWKRSLVRFKRVMWSLLLIAAPVFALQSPGESDLKAAAKAVRLEDYSQAFKLYSRAATNGNIEAQYQLANLYRLGKGVESSSVLERQWLEQAAANQHPGAGYNLALSIQSVDPQRAQALMQAAAATGFLPAKQYLQRGGRVATAAGSGQLTVADRWFAAARKNQTALLETLYGQVGDVDLPDAQQRTALAVAVQSGSLEAVAWLLHRGADPARRDRFGKSAGFIAIDSEQFSTLNKLFSAGLDPNSTLPNGDTLLHYAVRRDRTGLLPKLLQKPIAVNRGNADGWTALDLAMFAGAEEAVSLLRRHGGQRGDGWQSVDTDSEDIVASRWTGADAPDLAQLAKIVSAGNAGLLRQLAAGRPALIRQPLEDGRTLLAIAIANGQPGMVDALLELGASPGDRIDGELTALQWAAQNGQTEVANALLRRRADATATNSRGIDAIELALIGGHTELAESLLEQARETGVPIPVDRYLYTAARSDANTFLASFAPESKPLYRDDQGRSAVWYASSHGNTEVLESLLRRGLGDDTPDADGKTPLLIAAERGCLPCVERLAEVADLNRQTSSGDSALMLAAARSDRALVAWLIANGADVHRRNSQGDTALLAAVRTNAIDIVRLLVEAGASVSRKNRMGLSAQDIAARKGPEMLAALALK